MNIEKPPIMHRGKFMDTIRKGLGKRIRASRKLKSLTQEKLGEKAGLSYKFRACCTNTL